MIKLKGDFHMHTTASDGKLSPDLLVQRAKNKNMDIIAVTDHDSTSSLEEALACGLQADIRVIPGIELSTTHNKESIHILGYFRDDSYKSKQFQDFLLEMKNSRENRAKKLIDNLYTFFDIKLSYEQIYQQARGVIARPHIARAIIEAGYPYDWEYIFGELIGNHSPAYVPNKKVSIPDGLKLLKSANALTVLAHPILIKNSSLDEMMHFQFDGIEAVYSQNSPEQTALLTKFAADNNKLITAGSDFHGGDNGDTKHGDIGSVYLTGNPLEVFLSNL